MYSTKLLAEIHSSQDKINIPNLQPSPIVLHTKSTAFLYRFHKLNPEHTILLFQIILLETTNFTSTSNFTTS